MARKMVKTVIVLFAWFGFASGDCNECANGDSCASAYRGQPGHFCGHWAGLACCCPEHSVCIPTRVTCKCSHVKTLSPQSNSTTPVWDASRARAGGFIAALGWLGLFFCLYLVFCERTTPAFARQQLYIAIPPLHVGVNILAIPMSHVLSDSPLPTPLAAPVNSTTPLAPLPRWSRSHVPRGPSILSIPKFRQ
ncbi:hypothetical protein AC1031_003758 [Aphanomyces cochlioides]|nr:hypothetical protein AC1031_003758 [Aphanomyces cochlioides]